MFSDRLTGITTHRSAPQRKGNVACLRCLELTQVPRYQLMLITRIILFIMRNRKKRVMMKIVPLTQTQV